MYIPDFTYHKPNTIEEAFELLQKCPSVAPLAGGTDLLVEIKKGLRKFEDIVSLNSIDSLKVIREEKDNIIIGAGANLTDIINSDIIETYLPSLAETCETIGSHQIRNSATIGGNLCTCASCADTAPILMVNNANVEIASYSSNRVIKLTDFLKGHHLSDLKKGELLINIIIPKPKPNSASYFEKYGLRNSAAISVASVAVSLLIENEVINQANVVIGACAATPISCPKSLALLLDCHINEFDTKSEKLNEFGTQVAKEIFPIDDIRGTGNYRKDVVKAISQRALLEVINRLAMLNGESK